MKNQRRFIKRLLVSSLFIFMGVSSYAQHACAYHVHDNVSHVSQPNGNDLHIIINGDMFEHYVETEDGYTIVLDPSDNYYKYAYRNTDGDLLPTVMMASNSGERSPAENSFLTSQEKHLRYSDEKLEQLKLQKRSFETAVETDDRGANSFPSTGVNKHLLVLVEFPDKPLTYAAADFDDLMNEEGYSKHGHSGSLRDYILDNSYGELEVNTDIIGPFMADENKSYYGASYLQTQILVAEILDKIEAEGFDFSEYDNDGNGIVDNVTFTMQGRGEESTFNVSDFWSHKWELFADRARTFDGVEIKGYMVVPEKQRYRHLGSIIEEASLGVYIHEFGHALSLPDLYDTNGGVGGYSLGAYAWCSMAIGATGSSGISPGHYSVWCKQKLGWITPEILRGIGTVSDMDNFEEGANYYRINTALPNEYFLLENYGAETVWGTGPADRKGLLIWHITGPFGGGLNNNIDALGYLEVVVEQANGLFDIENNSLTIGHRSNGHPFPGATGNTSFTSATTPNSDFNAGGASEVNITSIVEDDGLISFNYNVPDIPDFCDNIIDDFPYNQGFEEQDDDDDSFEGWQQIGNEYVDWKQYSGPLSSPQAIASAPDNAVEGTYYISLPGTATYPGEEAELLSPCIDLREAPDANLSFAYYMYSTVNPDDFGDLNVKLTLDEGETWTTIWTRSGIQGDAWLYADIDLTAYTGNVIQLILEATVKDDPYHSQYNFTSIDDLEIVTDIEIVMEGAPALFDIKMDDELFIFPIPTLDFLNVIYSFESEEVPNYEIYTIGGQLVQTGLLDDGGIITKDLEKGTYLLKLKSGNEEAKAQFIKN